MPLTTPRTTAAFQASSKFVKRRMAQVATIAPSKERKIELTSTSRKLFAGMIFNLLNKQTQNPTE